MTLKKKILIGYGVAFALMGLVVAWAITNLVSLGKATDAILSENYRSILAAENMVDALERQDSGVLLMFLGDAEKGITKFRENEATFLEWLVRAKDNITIQGEAELVQSIEADYSSYRKHFSSLTDLRKAGGATLEPAHYQETVYPLFAKVREVCIGLRNLNEETMYAASVRAGGVARRAIWSTALVAAAALFVALMFSLLLAERDCQTHPAFHGGIAENLVGRLRHSGDRGNRGRVGASGWRVQSDGPAAWPLSRDKYRANHLREKQGRGDSFEHRRWLGGFRQTPSSR